MGAIVRPPMKLIRSTLLAAAGLALPGCADLSWFQSPGLEPAEGTAPTRVVEAGSVLGATVLGPGGTELGKVGSLMIDVGEGRATGVHVGPETEAPTDLPFVAWSGLRPTAGGVVLSEEAVRALTTQRDAIATRALFRGGEVERFAGTVSSVEELQSADGPTVCLVLVGDDNNRHRVGLGPAAFVKGVTLEPGVEAVVEAVRSRDEEGPLLVAGSVAVAGERLVLRDADGRATWALQRPAGLAVRALLGRPVERADGPPSVLADLELDPSDGRVMNAVLESPDGARVLVPWERVGRGEGGVLRLGPPAASGPAPQATGQEEEAGDAALRDVPR